MLRRKLSDVEIEELAASSEALLNDPVFQWAIDGLREEYSAGLIASPVGSAESMTAHASLKVLADLENKLREMITEKKMRAHRSRTNERN